MGKCKNVKDEMGKESEKQESANQIRTLKLSN